jgi:hypothetical protein
MVFIAYFMGGAASLGGLHFLSARSIIPCPPLKRLPPLLAIVRSPIRAVVCRGLGSLEGLHILVSPSRRSSGPSPFAFRSN